jgi:hypothetical protein
MKNIFKYSIISFSFLFYNCETNEKFSGSPVGNQEIITLNATITSDVEFATNSEEVEFNIILPRTFQDTVTVEVTAVNTQGGRIRENVDIMPGQVSPLEVVKIDSPGPGQVFSGKFELSLTAISLKRVEIGKHYLIKSNILMIDTGRAGSITAANESRLSVELVWPNISADNDVALKIEKPSGIVVEPTSQQSGGKLHSIRVDYSGNLNSNINNSNADGNYIFSMTGKNLLFTPVNMPYILIVVFPNGDRKFFTGTYQDLFINAPLKNLIKINKAPGAGVGNVDFTISEL